MKRLTIILTLLILTNCDLKSSDDYHRLGNELEKLEKYKEAIAMLNKAIEKNPNNIEALLDRAVDKSIIGDLKGSVLDYSKVIQIDPDNGLAFLNRGRNKLQLKDYEEAIADFNSAIATKGTEDFYMDKAENAFVETGFEFDISMEEVRFERGLAYYNIDSLKKSFQDFNFSIQKNYMLSNSYYMRGLIYLRYDMKKQGCSDLRNAKKFGNQEAEEIIEQYCK